MTDLLHAPHLASNAQEQAGYDPAVMRTFLMSALATVPESDPLHTTAMAVVTNLPPVDEVTQVGAGYIQDAKDVLGHLEARQRTVLLASAPSKQSEPVLRSFATETEAATTRVDAAWDWDRNRTGKRRYGSLGSAALPSREFRPETDGIYPSIERELIRRAGSRVVSLCRSVTQYLGSSAKELRTAIE